jgi:hypothetical protein
MADQVRRGAAIDGDVTGLSELRGERFLLLGGNKGAGARQHAQQSPGLS